MASFIIETNARKNIKRSPGKGGEVIAGFWAGLFACLLPTVLVSFLMALPASGQRVSILTPDKSEAAARFAELVRDELADKVRVMDTAMSEAAFLSSPPATPFNLSTDEAKKIGAAMGSDVFILLKSATQRRSAYGRNEYYEAYAAIYVISSRTGKLIWWRQPGYEAPTAGKAFELLAASVPALAAEIVDSIRSVTKTELAGQATSSIEDVPDADSPRAKNFRAPIPFRRIKPEYTAQASLYEVAATIDILVTVDEKGAVLATEITRWAGYGLEESVEKAVRQMNWRPAERDGKPLPMRFLLRYNFKKIDK